MKQKWNKKENYKKRNKKITFCDFAFSLNTCNNKLPMCQANFVAGLQPDIELRWNLLTIFLWFWEIHTKKIFKFKC